jgi:hypothetical protein
MRFFQVISNAKSFLFFICSFALTATLLESNRLTMISLNNPSFSANSDNKGYDEEEEADRDETKEVRKLSSTDTNRIRFGRLIVTLVLLLTAFAVTFTTDAKTLYSGT